MTGIGPDNLKFNLGEFQALFLKALRVIAVATPKFFSKGVDRVPHNVIALHWEVPDAIVDSELPDIISKEVEALLSNFSLQLKIVMFWQEPEVPLKVLRGNGNNCSIASRPNSALQRTMHFLRGPTTGRKNPSDVESRSRPVC